MNYIMQDLMNEMRRLLSEVGSDGGLLTPAVYETAQVLRFSPTTGDDGETIDWLLRHQQSDGGWGEPSAPLYRAVPTLAALLALVERGPNGRRLPNAIRSGVEAFQTLAHHWLPPLPDDMPIAAELILPRLLDDAQRYDLFPSTDAFDGVRQLGRRRRDMITRMRPIAATPPLHSWETWGCSPESCLIDGTGGVGHSPAATAWWLHLAHRRRQVTELRSGAKSYLASASRETLGAFPGVQPPAWPLHCFELAFVLHSLLMAGLLHDPRLTDVVAPLVQRLADTVGENGLGFSEFFMPDGDDTAAAVSVLAMMGRTEFVKSLTPFMAEDHFKAYPFELHHAPTVTARGAHALGLCGHENRPWLRALAASQLPDGRWVGDKWNRSWLYTTAVVLNSFASANDPAPRLAAMHALLDHQRNDGGWGSSNGSSSVQETAYAVLALNTLRLSAEWSWAAESAWSRAAQFLLRWHKHKDAAPERLWIHKELYTPVRIDRAFLLSAFLLIVQPETDDGRFKSRVRAQMRDA